MATVNVTTSQNISTVVYATDDTLAIQANVTLTISATPATRIGTITGLLAGAKLVVNNTSTTNMLMLRFGPNRGASNEVYALRFEAGGVVQMTGNWITVYTGTGASNQTVMANMTVGGATIDVPTFVEVETGSGTGIYKKWAVLPEMISGYDLSPFGYNMQHYTTGTVAVSAAGAVTGTGTAFVAWAGNKKFRSAGQAQDYMVSNYTSATSITISNPDGTTYSGPTIAAGATYTLKAGSAFERNEFGSGEAGDVLFLNPVTLGLQCGDGTNGNVIPNGAKVRMPNIYVTTTIPSTTLNMVGGISTTAATAITVVDGTDFPATCPLYSTVGNPGTLLIIDNPAAPTKVERIGYQTRTGNVFSATSMFRGAYYTTANTFPNGSTVKFIPQPTGNNGTCIDFTAGGTLECDKVQFSPYFYIGSPSGSTGLQNARKATFKNVGFSAPIAAPTAGVTGEITFDNVMMQPPMLYDNESTVSNRFLINNHTGPLTFKNAFVITAPIRGNSSSTQRHEISGNTDVVEINNLKVWMMKPNIASGGSSILIDTVDGITVNDLYISGNLTVALVANCVFENIYIGGMSLNPNFVMRLGSHITVNDNVTNCIFRKIKNNPIAGMGRNTFISLTKGAVNNIFHNYGEASINCSDQIGGLIGNSGTDNTFAYLDFTNNQAYTSGTPIGLNQTGPGTKIIKVSSDQWAASMTGNSGPALPYGGETNILFGPQTQVVNANFDIQPFTVLTDGTGAGSAGFLTAGPFLPEDTFTPYITGTSLTTYLDGTGRLYSTTTGDQVVVSSPFAMRGITSFNSASTISTAGSVAANMVAGVANNMTFEFRLCNWGDNISALGWTLMTPAALETARAALTGYSTSVGINIQMRVTSNTTVANRYITTVRMPIAWDTAYTPAVGAFDLNVTGVMTGSVVAVSLDGGTTWPSGYKATATGSTVTIPIDCNFLGTTTNLKVRIRKAGYQVLEYDLSTVDSDVDLPIEQAQVVDIDGVAVYGRGAGTTTAYITIVPGSLRVDIGNILVVGEDLYDACAAYQATTAGIAYPEILQFDGTDSIILNTWKLRRDVAGSTNAMIDMIVKYGPSVITNPVDEANGSVQLFPRTVRQGSLGAIAATVWDYQTSSATTSGSMGERLKDASTVATNGQQLTAALS